MSKKKILEEFAKKFYNTTNYKELDGAGYLYALWGEVECFLSQALDTIEKETKEKMAKALRMKETSPDDEYCEGWNDVVSILNENIDIYLKKHDN